MFDVFEVELERYLRIILADIECAKKDPQYHDDETLKKICRLRDGLQVAYNAAAELNVLVGKT